MISETGQGTTHGRPLSTEYAALPTVDPTTGPSRQDPPGGPKGGQAAVAVMVGDDDAEDLDEGSCDDAFYDDAFEVLP
jgi:hypothetical protein